VGSTTYRTAEENARRQPQREESSQHSGARSVRRQTCPARDVTSIVGKVLWLAVVRIPAKAANHTRQQES
jgi:hypothetical protein